MSAWIIFERYFSASKGLRMAVSLGVIALIVRLPFLGPGYGNDADAWRIVRSAKNFADTGQYSVSRFPGYPVVEGSFAALENITGGVIHFPVVTALLSAASVVILYQLLLRTLSRNAVYTALAFALTPIVLIESTTTMDYMWSLFFLLSSFLAVLSGRYVLAGLLLGFAVGSRVTAAVMIVPYLIALYGRHSSTAFVVATFKVCSAAAFMTLVCYSPVIMVYGLSFFTFYEIEPHPLAMAFGFSVGVWGIVGSISILIAIALVAKRYWVGREGLSNINRTELYDHFAFLSVIILYSVAYIRLPAESAYLIPLVPFVLALLFHNLTPTQCRACFALLVISPIVGFGDGHFRAPLVGYQKQRLTEMDLVKDAWRRAESEIGASVIVTGSWFENKIGLSKPKRVVKNIDVVSWIGETKLKELQRQNVTVLVLDPAIRWHQKRSSIDLRKYPISVIAPSSALPRQ